MLHHEDHVQVHGNVEGEGLFPGAILPIPGHCFSPCPAKWSQSAGSAGLEPAGEAAAGAVMLCTGVEA